MGAKLLNLRWWGVQRSINLSILAATASISLMIQHANTWFSSIVCVSLSDVVEILQIQPANGGYYHK